MSAKFPFFFFFLLSLQSRPNGPWGGYATLQFERGSGDQGLKISKPPTPRLRKASIPLAMSSRDHLFKVLVVGDAAVGKTSLVQRYSQDSFSKHYKSTVGGETLRGAVGAAAGVLRPAADWSGLGTGGFAVFRSFPGPGRSCLGPWCLGCMPLGGGFPVKFTQSELTVSREKGKGVTVGNGEGWV